jgi:hypothetical protein
MKPWIGSCAVNIRLIFVLQIVLNVAHFMVNDDQILHCHLSTLLDAIQGIQNKDPYY